MKTCNQCHEEMGFTERIVTGAYQDDMVFSACTNPECPSYALLQIPQEDMPKEEG